MTARIVKRALRDTGGIQAPVAKEANADSKVWQVIMDIREK
jgi:hypothetical protein